MAVSYTHLLNDMEKMTRPLGLVIFDTQRVSDMSATMAAASMMMMPMIIIFVLFQKQFIKGMTLSGIKSVSYTHLSHRF